MRDYAAQLAAAPVDLCCLGIGENGHLAFNDPPVADFADPETIKLVKLDEKCRRQQVGEGHFPNLDAVPAYAITLTIPALCRVGRMIAVVPEKGKQRRSRPRSRARSRRRARAVSCAGRPTPRCISMPTRRRCSSAERTPCEPEFTKLAPTKKL